MADKAKFRVPPFDFHKHREEYPAAGEVTTRISVTAFYRNVVIAYTRSLKASERDARNTPHSDTAQSDPRLRDDWPHWCDQTTWPESTTP